MDLEITEYVPDELDKMANALRKALNAHVLDSPEGEVEEAEYWLGLAEEVLEALEAEG